jgi:hypothetical protein
MQHRHQPDVGEVLEFEVRKFVTTIPKVPTPNLLQSRSIDSKCERAMRFVGTCPCTCMYISILLYLVSASIHFQTHTSIQVLFQLMPVRQTHAYPTIPMHIDNRGT